MEAISSTTPIARCWRTRFRNSNGQARESIAFLQKNDLVTLDPLCLETWRLEMSGREVQKSQPCSFTFRQMQSNAATAHSHRLNIWP